MARPVRAERVAAPSFFGRPAGRGAAASRRARGKRTRSGPALTFLLALAACGGSSQPWEGYALRERPGADGTRLVGAYGSAASCREALLAGASDPASEALVCTRGCSAPRDGIIESCAETRVVRTIDPLAAFTPPSEPAIAADRSPDSGSSPP